MKVTLLLLAVTFIPPALFADGQVPVRARVVPTDGAVTATTGTYLYDPSGNVAATGASSYIYDPMGRVTTAAVDRFGNVQSQTYTYDVYGNRISDGLSYPADVNTNRLTGLGAQYDAAGNLTQWQPAYSTTPRSYSYDPLHTLMLEKVTLSGGDEYVAHVYTADDERYWSFRGGASNASESNYMLRDLGSRVLREYVEATGGQWSTRDYIYRDGLLLASHDNPAGTTSHYSLDHLGTPRVVTDQDHVKVAEHTYFPFGAEYTDNSPTDGRLHFTGHEQRDSDLLGENRGELDYMHARYYSGSVGRFLSVDPGGAILSLPQSWNRYSYALNSPTIYRDPTGRTFQCFEMGNGQQLCTEWVDVSAKADYYTGIGGNVFDTPPAIRDRRPVPSAPAPCPMFVPPAPPGVNIDANINEAQQHQATSLDEYQWFKDQVGPNRPWDYKRVDPGKYESFGNFNYGATGAAMGIPDGVLQRAAGFYQPKKAQLPRWGQWWGGAPYGDDPADQEWMSRGIAYYRTGC